MRKSYSIKAKEFGRGKVSVDKFATLDEASAFIQERWQGIEYRDGRSSFHSDYCTYELVGFTFNDIGKVIYDDPENFYSRFFIFNTPIPQS
jgi:hypothetical protein